MKRSRLIAFLVAMILVLSCASSLGESYFNTEDYPICDVPVEVSCAFVTTASNHDWESRTMYQVFRDDFGIILNCQDFAKAADLNSQMTMWLAGDNMPDIIGNASFSVSDVAKWGSEGYLLNWLDYLDYMPNLKAMLEEYPDYKSFLTAPDGGIYGLTKLSLNVYGRVRRNFINNTWLENVGMSAPTTIDELYDVLVAFRDNDANGNGDPDDEIPFGYGESGRKDDVMLLAAFGILSASPDYALQLSEDGTVILANTGENYKAYLEFLHTLYEEGLIDKECFLITDKERKEKVKNDTYGMFAASAPFAWSGNSIDYDAGFSFVAGLTSEYNDERTMPLTTAVGSSVKFVVSAKTQYPEAIARLVDWALSEEGEVITQRGWEGVNFNYDYVECMGGYIANLIQPEGYTSTEDYKQNGVMMVDVFGPYASRGVGTQYRLIEVAPDDVIYGDEAVALYGWAVLVERVRREEGIVESDVFPALVYTAQEASARAGIQTDISNYVKSARAQFIIGELSLDDDWDTYVEQINAMGLAELLEIENAAYERYAAAK